MKSQIRKIGDTIIVSVHGKLDYETQDSFKEDLQKLARTHANQDSVPSKIIFNMEQLEFVGSSGISQFIQTVKDFAARTEQKARIVKASSDFKKVMKAFDETHLFEFIEQDDSVFPNTSRSSH